MLDLDNSDNVAWGTKGIKKGVVALITTEPQSSLRKCEVSEEGHTIKQKLEGQGELKDKVLHSQLERL